MMTSASARGLCARLVLGVLAGVALAPAAHATPSFARQTGMSCQACHTVFPELTHFGRMFKANGYTLDNLTEVRGITPQRQEILALSGLPPISAMVQVSDTQVKSPLPDSTAARTHSQTGTVGFPQQISLFYAGEVAPHIGAFIQLTYENDAGTIGIDNTDLRYANSVIVGNQRSLVYGLSLNNNPTVEDLWNSTPAWGYPFAATNANVSPLAATQIDGTLAQSVAGLCAYVLWDESLYVEAGVYRSAQQGVTNPLTGAAGPLDGTASNVIRGVAPYGRIAYEYDWGPNSLEVGTYGANFKLYPGGGSSAAPAALSGPVNRFTDIAEDFQYQFIGVNNLLTISGTRIHESMQLSASYAAQASANPSDSLTTLRLEATYYYQRRYGGTLAHFSTTGTSDGLLYPTGPAPGVVTSANGSPDTRGWTAELDYLPWLNTKFSLQYTHYTEFNGGGSNYDGFGRNAADNDTTYLLAWVAF